MSHTPGPWTISNDTIGSDYGDIARVHFQSSRNARGWDDRSVIAAAPDMLDALRTADDALDYAQAQVDSESDRERLRQWRTRVQNVIALAEGR